MPEAEKNNGEIPELNLPHIPTVSRETLDNLHALLGNDREYEQIVKRMVEEQPTLNNFLANFWEDLKVSKRERTISLMTAIVIYEGIKTEMETQEMKFRLGNSPV